MCELGDVFIVGAARTAIGNFLGSLKNFRAPELGGFAINEAVKRAGISGEDVEEVIMGNVVSGGLGQAPAKQAAVNGGIPYTVSCFAVNKVCGSALKAVALAAQKYSMPCQVCMEAYMACGIGACKSCAVETTEGIKMACKDGPVFSASVLVWK